jgi:hypothetical protein
MNDAWFTMGQEHMSISRARNFFGTGPKINNTTGQDVPQVSLSPL